jgi:coenzyme F420 hydrogenase subunit beta
MSGSIKKVIGDFINCYSGFSKNEEMRFNSSSGGVVSSLLIFALKEKIIDGAIVVKMKKNFPLEAESFIATTEEEILSSRGSKYCHISISEVVGKLARSNLEKVVVVGLPCQISGIRKMAEKNKILKNKILFYFGIFCNRVPDNKALGFLFKKYKVIKNEVLELNYRGNGWPGFMQITLKDGKKINISLNDYWNIIGSDYFTPKACLFCSDHTGENSDLSFGDAWLAEFNSDKKGTTAVISRTKLGEQLLRSSSSEITFGSLDPNKILSSQIISLYLKKKLSKIGSAKDYCQLRPDFVDYLIKFLIKINSKTPPYKFTYLFRKAIKWMCYKKALIYFKSFK